MTSDPGDKASNPPEAPPPAGSGAAPPAAGTAAAPAAPARKPAPVAPAPQIPKNPGGAARLAKAATIVADREQAPLAGSPDIGWWVLNTVMMVGLVVLAGIVLYSCTNVAGALWDMM